MAVICRPPWACCRGHFKDSAWQPITPIRAGTLAPTMIPQLLISFLTMTLCLATVAGNCFGAEPLGLIADNTAPARLCAERNATYSVLVQPSAHCPDDVRAPMQPNKIARAPGKIDDEKIDDSLIATEMLSFSVIGIAQLRGGTELLSNLWYAGSVLIPPFMERDAQSNVKQNYVAVAPPCILLGITNGFLRRDDAASGRVFLINFAGFNLGLLWSRHILNKSKFHFDSTEPIRKLGVNASLVPLYDGAALNVSMHW